jgi:hypothetical protein
VSFLQVFKPSLCFGYAPIFSKLVLYDYLWSGVTQAFLPVLLLGGDRQEGLFYPLFWGA